jgi:hypothetical protein
MELWLRTKLCMPPENEDVEVVVGLVILKTSARLCIPLWRRCAEGVGVLGTSREIAGHLRQHKQIWERRSCQGLMFGRKHRQSICSLLSFFFCLIGFHLVRGCLVGGGEWDLSQSTNFSTRGSVGLRVLSTRVRRFIVFEVALTCVHAVKFYAYPYLLYASNNVFVFHSCRSFLLTRTIPIVLISRTFSHCVVLL